MSIHSNSRVTSRIFSGSGANVSATGALIYALLFSAVPQAFAHDDGSLHAHTEIDTQIDAQVSTPGSASTGTQVSGNISSDTSVDGEASVVAGASTSPEEETSDGEVILETNSDGVVGIGVESTGTSVSILQTPIVLTKADVTASTDTRISNASEVSNEADLQLFAQTLIANDNHIDRISFSEESTSLKYDQKVKLFGFIPMTTIATAEVDANGDVRVSYPWYRFLVKTDKTNIETELRSAVQAELKSESAANIEGTLEARARIAEVIRSTLQTRFNASSSADAEVSTN